METNINIYNSRLSLEIKKTLLPVTPKMDPKGEEKKDNKETKQF
jgi:hypothetical protein